MRQAELVILMVVSLLTGYGCKKREGQVKPNKPYKIAFTSHRDGNDEIYVMNADGSGQKRLTNNPAKDVMPHWSPDGKEIIFVSVRDGNAEIYIMYADGNGQMRLTNNPAIDREPRWSPDGKKIAFVSRRDGDFEIYVMNTDGSGQKNLTRNIASDTKARWSLDGEEILFKSHRGGDSEIYVMNTDGSGQENLTNASGYGAPNLSPDARKIAFVSSSEPLIRIPFRPVAIEIPSLPERKFTRDIYVMNPDGSEKKRLTDTGSDWSPVWSPVPLATVEE
jgi:TolB protein